MHSCNTLSSSEYAEDGRPNPSLQNSQLCIRIDLALPSSPTGLAPSSFLSLSGPLPRQAAQACFQFLEHSFPPGGSFAQEFPLPGSSPSLSPEAMTCYARLSLITLPQPGHWARSVLPITPSSSFMYQESLSELRFLI